MSGLIGLDWGTSSLRAYWMGAEGIHPRGAFAAVGHSPAAGGRLRRRARDGHRRLAGIAATGLRHGRQPQRLAGGAVSGPAGRCRADGGCVAGAARRRRPRAAYRARPAQSTRPGCDARRRGPADRCPGAATGPGGAWHLGVAGHAQQVGQRARRCRARLLHRDDRRAVRAAAAALAAGAPVSAKRWRIRRRSPGASLPPATAAPRVR